MARAGASRRRRAGMIGALLGLGVPVFLGALPLHADLLRCEGPDGRTIFTDDPALCPGAEPYEPSGAVHSVEPAAPAPSNRQTRIDAMKRRRLADRAEAGEAERWKLKKRAVEEELRRLQLHREDLLKRVAWCNRGGRVVTFDDAGIKKAVPCSEVRQDLKSLDEQEAAILLYLQVTLADDCRRAGCLPGWLR